MSQDSSAPPVDPIAASIAGPEQATAMRRV